jgi:ATP-binding cassette subfamily C (CFTR/MRP) protein 1
MQRIIHEEFKDCTVVAIAHRDTRLDFDRIAVLDQGVIVDYDTPEKLLRGPSRFRALYEKYEGKRLRVRV